MGILSLLSCWGNVPGNARRPPAVGFLARHRGEGYYPHPPLELAPVRARGRLFISLLASPSRACPRDPLAHNLARRHIDQPQYLAGREFQNLAGKVNGSQDPLMAKSYRPLGADGTAVAHAMLIGAMSAKEAAASRGLAGLGWEKFYRMRPCSPSSTGSAMVGDVTISVTVQTS